MEQAPPRRGDVVLEGLAGSQAVAGTCLSTCSESCDSGLVMLHIAIPTGCAVGIREGHVIYPPGARIPARDSPAAAFARRADVRYPALDADAGGRPFRRARRTRGARRRDPGVLPRAASMSIACSKCAARLGVSAHERMNDIWQLRLVGRARRRPGSGRGSTCRHGRREDRPYAVACSSLLEYEVRIRLQSECCKFR